MIRVILMLIFFVLLQHRRRNRHDLWHEAGRRAGRFPADGTAAVCVGGSAEPLVVVAMPLLAASFYSLLILLSWAPISVVIPASAFNYVVGTFGAKYLLKEDVSFKRWMGVLLVIAGVAIVLKTGGH